MKIPKEEKILSNSPAVHHVWTTVGCIIGGVGVMVLAVLWIRRCKSSGSKHEYCALRSDASSERQLRDGAFNSCKIHLAENSRYELKCQLGDVGSRADKHWFIVQDSSLRAERLLTFMPIPITCPIQPSASIRETLLELFRGLQHPYIHPILDIEFWQSGVALVAPMNPIGSLRDLIYGSYWQDDWDDKYNKRGSRLHLRQIQCIGRQVLEALLFLRERRFPPSYHIHSGNVIVQNGAARLAGLENTLLGLLPRPPAAPETLGFGYLLFEMTAGYEILSPPTPAHLQLELEREPKVAEVLELIFGGDRSPPAIEELICCDLFRGIELRELRGASGIQTRMTRDVAMLMEAVRSPVAPPPVKSGETVVVIERRFLEDIEEEPETDEDYESIER